MSNIQVMLELPKSIETGLAVGQYERVGGIIRRVSDKRVVMWLQEGGRAASNPNASKGLMASVMKSTGASSATVGAVLGGTLTTLNIAMSGYTLYLMIERVKELEQQIEQLYETVSEEFARDRRINFEAALANAHDVVDATNPDYKQKAANQAIDQLFKARQHRIADFDALLDEAITPEQFQRAQTYLLQAMMVSTMRARCYLETDQVDMARSRLRDAIEVFKPRMDALIRKWLTDHPALYFHDDIAENDFDRFLNIEGWVRDTDDVLAELVREYRSDFWSRDAIKSLSGSSFSLPFFNREGSETDEPMHLRALTQAELLIENYHRLEGFELELASMRLRFSEWDSLIDSDARHEDYILLVDQDMLSASERLSQ